MLRKWTKQSSVKNARAPHLPDRPTDQEGKASDGAAAIGVIAVTMARVETTSNRPYHLIIFGASGFTGQFVVEEVARSVSEGPNGTLKWAIAGRSKQKLEKVLEEAAGVLSMNTILCY